MKIWFTSDLHLGHARICELSNRPFDSVEEMNQALINRWNNAVGEEDHVYVLGDVCMGRIAETLPLVGELKGTKYLIAGNHDRVWPTYWPDNKQIRRSLEFRTKYLEYFDRVVVPSKHDPCLIDFSFVHGARVTAEMCHLPFYGVEKDADREQHLEPWRPEDKGQWLLHGHVHEAWQVNGRQINVGVDAWNYTPVPSGIIAAMIRERELEDNG